MLEDQKVEAEQFVELVGKATETKPSSSSTNQKLALSSINSTTAKESVCWFLYWAVIIVDIPILAAGLDMSWTSPIIPKLQGKENPFDHVVTTSQEAWIAALNCVGSALGPLAAGYCADKIGRKKVLLFLALPMVVGFVILAYAKHVELYYLARFLVGLGSGSAFAVVPMYLGEICQAHNRGKFSSAIGVMFTVGTLYPFSVGPHLSIPVYSLCCTLPLIVFIAVFALFMPESPYYLVTVGDTKGAYRALKKLRPRRWEINTEMAEIKQYVIQEGPNTVGVKDTFSSYSGRKAMLVSFGLLTLSQFSGIVPVLSFLETIFKATGSSIPSNTSTLITGTIQVLSNIACILMVERIGKKMLLEISCIFCFLSLTLLGIYFYLKSQDYNVEPIFWLPITSLVVYMLVFSFGLGPLPWAVMGEIFPSNIKGIATSLISTSGFVTSALLTFLFPVLSEVMGMAGCFWVFACCCFVGYFFVHFVLFETKGKSLGEIQRFIRNECSK